MSPAGSDTRAGVRSKANSWDGALRLPQERLPGGRRALPSTRRAPCGSAGSRLPVSHPQHSPGDASCERPLQTLQAGGQVSNDLSPPNAQTLGLVPRGSRADLPGGPVVETPPANAGTRLNPWSGKTPQASGQLSPRVQREKARVRQQRPSAMLHVTVAPLEGVGTPAQAHLSHAQPLLLPRCLCTGHPPPRDMTVPLLLGKRLCTLPSHLPGPRRPQCQPDPVQTMFSVSSWAQGPAHARLRTQQGLEVSR